MPSVTTFLAFAGVSFVLIVVPGPSVLFVISRAITAGRRVALWTVVGNAGGVYVQVLAVAVGLGALVARSIAVFTVVKVVGAGYLIWLGIRAIRDRREVWGPDAGAIRSARRARSPAVGGLVDGFAVGVGNPKAIVFFAAILPQFVRPDGMMPGVQMAVLGLVFVAVALGSDSAWALAAGGARAMLARSPRRRERLAIGGGVAMIGLGVHLALTRRPT